MIGAPNAKVAGESKTGANVQDCWLRKPYVVDLEKNWGFKINPLFVWDFWVHEHPWHDW